MLTRLPILKSKNYDLSVERREPRGALRCDLDLGGGTAAARLLPAPGAVARASAAAQEGLLLSSDILRDAVRKDPVVVCGDFNYWGNRPVPSLVRRAIHDAALELRTPARTYPSRVPLLRLDRIFVDTGVRPLSIQPHRTPLATVTSDHLPLVMRFEAPVLPEDQAASAPVQLIG